jgi:transforming growth factor-beta-induced protein
MRTFFSFETPAMRRVSFSLLIGLLAGSMLLLAGCDSNDGGMDEPASVTGAVTNNDNLETLATALGATGQDETLDDSDKTFTVFAPSDAAFMPYDVDFLTDEANSELLSNVLGYHVVTGAAVNSGDLQDEQTFTTLQGDQIEVRIVDGDIFVEGAQVTTADVETGNGVAHVVDDVLLTNRTPLERLQVNEATQELRRQLRDANLDDDLNNNTWTTFAPSNQAFNNTDLSGFTNQEIQEILQYHTLDGATDSEALIQTLDNNGGQVTLTTNQGEDVTVEQQSDGSIVFNPSSQNSATLNLDRVDQRAGNGSIIHQIDGVLVPPSF